MSTTSTPISFPGIQGPSKPLPPHITTHFSRLDSSFVIPLPSKQILGSAPAGDTPHFHFIPWAFAMHVPLPGVLSLFLLPEKDSYSSINAQLRRCFFWFKHRASSVGWRPYSEKELQINLDLSSVGLLWTVVLV